MYNCSIDGICLKFQRPLSEVGTFLLGSNDNVRSKLALLDLGG